ncbi:uncharacterized protein LOC123202811 isoform X4 [Mangifera indica]|uniref:uncharacterized protein LOC123202811 isoform X4 n=1 Tax=Mangifera indica TaxID=29780 RepID=UPI001CFA3142|nr:uncharacterized protein LOC123202811 isoform X4 [Mangifera indica]
MMLLSCTLNLPNISNLPNPETELEHFGRFGIAVRYCNKQQTQPNSANRKLLNFLLNKNELTATSVESSLDKEAEDDKYNDEEARDEVFFPVINIFSSRDCNDW